MSQFPKTVVHKRSFIPKRKKNSKSLYPSPSPRIPVNLGQIGEDRPFSAKKTHHAFITILAKKFYAFKWLVLSLGDFWTTHYTRSKDLLAIYRVLWAKIVILIQRLGGRLGIARHSRISNARTGAPCRRPAGRQHSSRGASVPVVGA